MKLSVPFIPDEKYTNFLKNETMNIESVYFSLFSGPILDARMRFRPVSLDTLAAGLQTLGPVKKYCLLNSRFIHPGLYHDSVFLNQTLDQLECLVLNAGITGIVFSDAYLLAALSATKRQIIHRLEAVPGINCMIDSSQKAFAFFELIEQTGFNQPGKLVLDRSLNRDRPALEKASRQIKQKAKNIKIELLANEGCIYHCPFKLAHDAQISLANTGLCPNQTFQTNQVMGCHAYFSKTPAGFFKSPFIRPEDVHAYRQTADTIKICGRTLGQNFLFNCIRAYAKESYPGNLLDLMDATHWLSDIYYVDNKKLDPDFYTMVSTCTKECKTCRLCHDLFSRTASRTALTIKPYEDYL